MNPAPEQCSILVSLRDGGLADRLHHALEELVPRPRDALVAGDGEGLRHVRVPHVRSQRVPVLVLQPLTAAGKGG